MKLVMLGIDLDNGPNWADRNLCALMPHLITSFGPLTVVAT